MTPASFTPDDPVWTAYALGEVSPKEKAGLDAALKFSPEGEAQVEKLRLAAQNLREAWTAEKVEVIPLDAAPFVDGVLSEAGYGEGAAGASSGGWNLGFTTLSPKYVVVGFAVIVAAVGGTAWELHQEPRPAFLRWIPPMGAEAPADVSAAPAVATTVEALPPAPPAATSVPATPPPPLADNVFDVRPPEPETSPSAPPAPASVVKGPQPSPALGSPALVPAAPPEALSPAAPTSAPAASSDDADRAARKERLDRLREQLAQQTAAAPTPAAPSSSAPSAFPDAVASTPILTETEVPLTTTAPGSLTFVPGPLRPVAQPVTTGFALAEVVPVLSAVVLAPKERTADGASVEEGGGVRLVDYGAGTEVGLPAPAPFVMLAQLYPSPWAQDGSRQLLVVALRPTTPAQVARPPATLVFVVDNSLSMGAPDRLAAFKKAVVPFLDRLQPGDRVGIVTYAGSSTIALPLTEIPRKGAKVSPTASAPLVSAPVAGSPGNDGTPSEGDARTAIRAAFARLAVVAADRPGASLRAAYDMARKGEQPDGYTRVIVVTDGDLPSLGYGQSGTGGMAGEVGRQALGGTTTSVMFLGREAADGPLLRQVVAAGKGRGSVLRTAGGVETVLDREIAPPRPAAVKDVKLQVALAPEAVGAWRLIGYENGFPVTGNGAAPKEGEGLLAFYELQRPATAAPVDLTARYRVASSGAPGKESLRVGGLSSGAAPLSSKDVTPQVMRAFEKEAGEVRDRLAALSPDTRPGIGSRSAGSAQESVPNGSGATPDEAYKNFRQNAEEWLDGAKKP